MLSDRDKALQDFALKVGVKMAIQTPHELYVIFGELERGVLEGYAPGRDRKNESKVDMDHVTL